MNVQRYFGVSLCALAGMLSAACRSGSSTTSSITTTTSASPINSIQIPPGLPDAEIQKAIALYLREDGALHDQPVDVAVAGGIVTLSGTVRDLLAKERSEKIAQTIRGVRAVVNQVTVAASSRTDAQLKADVKKALSDDLATRPYKIDVAVADGKVTLIGVADSWPQKDLFADVAKEVPGVRALENNVALNFASKRSPTEIKDDVDHRLANDVWLEGDVLTAKLKGNDVAISGVVGSLVQKARAQVDGHVAGVDSVDVSGVLVDAYAQDQERQSFDDPVRSDAQIAAAIRDAFRYDGRLVTLVPDVSVQKGIVTLRGPVYGQKARRAAEADARDTVGVRGVHDEIYVTKKLAPAEIESLAKRVIIEDKTLPDKNAIQVSNANGKVMLSGTVKSDSERFNAVADVGEIPGVIEVRNGLVVERSPDAIQQRIRERLDWDPLVQQSRVHVDVASDGTATLTGTVDAPGEIEFAADDALRGGAAKVVNHLELKNHPEVIAP